MLPKARDSKHWITFVQALWCCCPAGPAVFWVAAKNCPCQTTGAGSASTEKLFCIVAKPYFSPFSKQL